MDSHLKIIFDSSFLDSIFLLKWDKWRIYLMSSVVDSSNPTPSYNSISPYNFQGNVRRTHYHINMFTDSKIPISQKQHFKLLNRKTSS